MRKIDVAIMVMEQKYNDILGGNAHDICYGDMWLSDVFEIAIRCLYEKRRAIDSPKATPKSYEL